MTNMTTYRLTESKLRRLISEAVDSARIQARIEQEYGGYERGLTWSTLYVEMAADYMAKELGISKMTVVALVYGKQTGFHAGRADVIGNRVQHGFPLLYISLQSVSVRCSDPGKGT